MLAEFNATILKIFQPDIQTECVIKMTNKTILQLNNKSAKQMYIQGICMKFNVYLAYMLNTH
jgi:hypothetical protein